MVDNAFIPQQISVHRMDTVVWINQGNTTHTTTSGTPCMPDGVWDSGFLEPGERFSFVFKIEGTYPYSCLIWCCCGMVGEVHVDPHGVEEGIYDNRKEGEIQKIAPNPGGREIEIIYLLENTADVDLGLYSIVGERVITLWRGTQGRGIQRVKFSNISPLVVSQVFFVVLKVEGKIVDVKRILFLNE